LSRRARALVLALPGNEDVVAALWGSIVTGFWSVPIPEEMERDLAIIKQWEEDPDPSVRPQIREYIEGMERNLRQESIREEEGDLRGRRYHRKGLGSSAGQR
jgi:hypothetical protein